MVSELAAPMGCPFYYCNAIGGNDELLFDGNSFAIDASGNTIFQMPGFPGGRWRRADLPPSLLSRAIYRLNKRSMKHSFWAFGITFRSADSRPRFLV